MESVTMDRSSAIGNFSLFHHLSLDVMVEKKSFLIKFKNAT